MAPIMALGGQARPLRFDPRFPPSCTHPYSEAEARQGFQDMDVRHRAFAPCGEGAGRIRSCDCCDAGWHELCNQARRAWRM